MTRLRVARAGAGGAAPAFQAPEPPPASRQWIRETTASVALDRSAAGRRRLARELDKRVSVITLSWDQLHHTKRFVRSLRASTRVNHELIVVDNGSAPPTAAWVEDHADVALLNRTNRGFAAGMNQGLARATGEYVVFINNDTRLPEGWLVRLIEALNALPGVGLVAPVVTNGGGFISLRRVPGRAVLDIHPFSYPPPGVCYLMRTAVAREIGGWPEHYRVASSEDTDLCFTLWSHGYRILLDERVLVEHVSKGTAAAKLDDWRALWSENRARFFERWGGRGEAPVAVQAPPGLRHEDVEAVGQRLAGCLEALRRAVAARAPRHGADGRGSFARVEAAVAAVDARLRNAVDRLVEDRTRHAHECGTLWARIESRRRQRQEVDAASEENRRRLAALAQRAGAAAYPSLARYLWRRFGVKVFRRLTRGRRRSRIVERGGRSAPRPNRSDLPRGGR